MSANVHEIYRAYIEPLPASERLQLLAMLAQGLASQSLPSQQTKRSIMEMHGLGKQIWEGVDARNYVDQLRQEWEQARSSDEA